MKITCWSDYACPYCYIGEVRLKKALAQLPEGTNIEVEMKSFQLDPAAGKHAESDTQTRFSLKYGISFEAAGRQIESISRMGRGEGLDFRYAQTLFTNTMDAHRLTKLAQSKDDPALTERVTEALFDAYFTQNLELADLSLLAHIGEDCGLDPEEVKGLLESSQYRDEVLLDEREAARLGIHAVPFFVIDGKYTIPGVPDTEGLVRGLRMLLEAEAEEAAPDEEAKQTGSACGPEGCRLS